MISMKSARVTLAATVLAFCLTPFTPAVSAEKWDFYVYNAVSTVAAVKGLNTVIEQIDKETAGELTIRLHLGGSLPINTTTITQAVSDDVVQMGDDGYFLGNVPIGGVHGFRNESGEPATMLLHFAPGAPREGYFEGLPGLGEHWGADHQISDGVELVGHAPQGLLQYERQFDRMFGQMSSLCPFVEGAIAGVLDQGE